MCTNHSRTHEEANAWADHGAQTKGHLVLSHFPKLNLPGQQAFAVSSPLCPWTWTPPPQASEAGRSISGSHSTVCWFWFNITSSQATHVVESHSYSSKQSPEMMWLMKRLRHYHGQCNLGCLNVWMFELLCENLGCLNVWMFLETTQKDLKLNKTWLRYLVSLASLHNKKLHVRLSAPLKTFRVRTRRAALIPSNFMKAWRQTG